MEEFPVYKAFVSRDLVFGVPRMVFMIIYALSFYVVMAAGQFWFIVITFVSHLVCYVLTKYVDPNFIEILMSYVVTEDDFQ